MGFDKTKAGLIVAAVFGFLGFIWSILVAFGMPAIHTLNGLLRLFYLRADYWIGGFSANWGMTVILISGTAGFVAGWLLAALMNVVGPKPQPAALKREPERERTMAGR
jgi:hypothetical protein